MSGTVTVVTRLPLGSHVQSRRFTVTYDFRGPRSARVNDAFANGDFHVGDQVTLYVDPAHPDRVALADGQASEGLILLLPPFVVVLGIARLIGLIGVRMRWWRRFGRGRSVDASMLELVTTYESDEALQWKSAQRALRVAVEAASARHSGPLNLLVYLRIGVRGGARVAWYWRKSRQLVVVVPLADRTTGHPQALRDAVGLAIGMAEKWSRRHLPGADISDLAIVAERAYAIAESDRQG